MVGDAATRAEMGQEIEGGPAPANGLFELVLEVVERWTGERPAVWLALGREGFLGLWPPETGGAKAIHNGRGGAHVHFAIRVPRGTLAATQARIEALGVPVEGGWDFGPGNRAIYLDDPDGNVVELTERATLWDGRPATEESAARGRRVRG